MLWRLERLEQAEQTEFRYFQVLTIEPVSIEGSTKMPHTQSLPWEMPRGGVHGRCWPGGWEGTEGAAFLREGST